MRGILVAALVVCMGCSGGAPDAGDGAGTGAGPGLEAGPLPLPLVPCDGLYTCVEPGASANSFPVTLSELGGACTWAVLVGRYELRPDGTVTYDGMPVATWSGTSSEFVVNTATAGTSLELAGPEVTMTCTLSAREPACGEDAAPCDEAGAGVDAGSWDEADDDGEGGASLDGGPYPEPRDGSPVTWDGWVSGFSSYYCAACHNAQASCSSGECHVPTDPALYALVFDTQQRSAWAERASTIQCGIAATQAPGAACSVPPETFPKMEPGAPLPPDDERAILVNWLAAGCP